MGSPRPVAPDPVEFPFVEAGALQDAIAHLIAVVDWCRDRAVVVRDDAAGTAFVGAAADAFDGRLEDVIADLQRAAESLADESDEVAMDASRANAAREQFLGDQQRYERDLVRWRQELAKVEA